MKVAEQVSLGGGGLDRRADRRAQAGELWQAPGARVLPLWRGRPLVAGDGTARPLGLATLAPADAFLDEAGGETVYLGEAGAAPLFARDVSGWQPDSEVVLDAGPGRAGADQPAPALTGLPSDARFADLRAVFPALDPFDAECAVTAKGILEWHRTHSFCARCGAPSVAADGGWRRDCPSCARAHFPRTDPVVIMLVTRGNELLIGRSPGWPEGFYSLLAGFMEPGETVAAAVRREVAEETGIAVGEVRLLASQPWPFPASLMIGCIGTTQSTAITLDPKELDDALWIGREELMDVFAGRHPRIATPRRGAIAHFLMKMWLADRLD
ncbi:NAD(+) diphosphatase [Sinisalibacter aestuarii]|uniref:NAD(+) diphosphatase n=1 Tax=Sinisalibacter aestuarii TaxID=2949426 RepID=A0ABQ5LML6_9RHOB|nr:NAD(+) diphosphatase [Sinisalibacter aestuarii]GKY86198.1 NADH pyrophosphatase [Sinisalibacter aestuarii]